MEHDRQWNAGELAAADDAVSYIVLTRHADEVVVIGDAHMLPLLPLSRLVPVVRTRDLVPAAQQTQRACRRRLSSGVDKLPQNERIVA